MTRSTRKIPAITTAFLAMLVVFQSQVVAQDAFNPLIDFGINNQQDEEPVTFSGQFFSVDGSRQGKIDVTAIMGLDWYVYSVTQDNKGATPTSINIVSDDVKVVGDWIPNKKHKDVYEKIGKLEYHLQKHLGEVTWSAPIEINEGVDTENLKITIKIEGQVCKEGCQLFEEELVAQHAGVVAASEIKIVNSAQEIESPTESGSAGAVEQFDMDSFQVEGSGADKYSLPAILGLALLGGFILNFMPCVLPVIGLKVLSFVQQAGSDKKTAFMLNVWYSAGLISVFLVLGLLAALLNFGWGEQSQSPVYQVTMSAIVFVMGLSFLGVWEIPIPGFVGSGKTAELAEKEGVTAAFVKGIITTILAVPCSGPGIAYALTWTTGKPTPLVLLVFLFMGLGMALPYLVIGMNPKLVKFIPKPGPWMETFKQIMGFFLLATVIWLLWTMSWSLVLPTVAFLFGLWVSCWIVGRTSMVDPFPKRMRSWAVAGAVGAVLGWLSLGLLGDVVEKRYENNLRRELVERGAELEDDVAHNPNHLNWKPYTKQRLQEEFAAGNNVMVDFTADW